MIQQTNLFIQKYTHADILLMRESIGQSGAVISVLFIYLFGKAGLITVWLWTPSALLAFTDGSCWSHIIKTVWFTPKTHYFITPSLRSVWLAAIVQLIANLLFIISFLFFVSPEEKHFLSAWRGPPEHSDVKRGKCLNIATYFRVKLCFI